MRAGGQLTPNFREIGVGDNAVKYGIYTYYCSYVCY